MHASTSVTTRVNRLKAEPKNGSWNTLIPSTAAEAAALRANGLLTNWVSVEKTVRAEPVEAWTVFYDFNCRF